MAKKVTKTSLNLTRGKRLGKYRLDKCLGEGGSCEVWKAKDCVEGLWVALKIPLMDVNGERDNQALFHEIRLVSKLRHRHIMPVKNADVIEGHVVLATELSYGTLDDCSRPMSIRRILSIITQVLDGLAYAHRNRLVHCDVTPGNIFLFPNDRAALGDFGISLRFKGRMKTVDDFGTPGYVAPEQAYGRPTYRSDCFAVGVILYEFMTGVLPRWPFRWPLRGHKRLRERTNTAMVRFLRKSLAVDPERRFAGAAEMLGALLQAAPKGLQKGLALQPDTSRKLDWRKVRRDAFVRRYGKVFSSLVKCIKCGEPIAECMLLCPWCGSDRNRFDRRSPLSHICPTCHRGVLPEWRFCPWCYGCGFQSPSRARTAGVRYNTKCKYCDAKIMRFMRYCPWCHRKVRRPWRVRPFPEICTKCGWSVDTEFWNYCPWCKESMT
ncbi:MAG: protein kinase domain-containing protein [Planctomycetota bacterium]|jgi:serine/threonine-protein kinase